MADKLKTFLAALFFFAALTLPLIGLGFGWIRWDFTTGILMMLVIFLFFSVLGVATLLWVKDLSWISVSLPFVFSMLYGFLPDTIPYSIDDAAISSVGALFTYGLSLRKNPKTPRWIFIPLLAAALYALLGGTIPGGFDEVIVGIIGLVIARTGARQAEKEELSAGEEQKV